MPDVVCLRPEADFARVDALPPRPLAVVYKAPDDKEVPGLLRQASALVIPAVGPNLAPSLFEGTALKLVQVTGAGVDRLDQQALQRAGIPVANVPGGSNSAVAEYVVATACVLLRRLAWADAEIKLGRYSEFRARMLADNLAGLDGLLVGIVGMGVIGAAVGEAFRKMGCRLAYYDPAPANEAAAEALGAQPLSLEELLAGADVVTLHVPLLPGTRHLIGERQLARMKSSAVLIQASRGGVVDEEALAAVLGAGKLGGAAIDVYGSEPPPSDNPLFALDGEARHRVLFTPHIAGVTRQSAAYLFRSAWQNVERVLLRHEAPLHRVY